MGYVITKNRFRQHIVVIIKKLKGITGMVNNQNTGKKKINVLVVGAGPAGVSAAFFIKHYDTEDAVTVTLAERLDDARYPVYHDMCGEAVSQLLSKDLEPLQPEGIVEKIHLIREYYPGNIVLESQLKGYMIDRTGFFRSIIREYEKIGGMYRNETVSGISQNNEHIVVKFEHRTQAFDYVIAADGANSQIRNALGMEGKKIKLIQYIVDERPSRGILEFHYDEAYEGNYQWVFPHENNIKIGFPALPGKSFEPDGHIIRKQARFIAYGGLPHCVVGRILLIGDAACQTNPISKGGIRAGMIAGKMAAQAIHLRNPKAYEDAWKRSVFSSDMFLKAYIRLQRMKNAELESHIRPFYEYQTSTSALKKGKLWMDLALHYRRYLDIYKAYKAIENHGW
jgi:digeranylgeranylglycerophospholipid reductase